ncbi:OmpA family protein [Aggregatimonas sangjinii]|uniref:OmpA family protein n=1 Tax=Aggregatimonas sangjinii TaxID=2583587 RepID=A0A5B7SX38_9FLAO|nr:OmpA family protein [Aggregatimonas sangjinii]QCX01588.1 OmpA family protein [Aggregatimonas sangjinii]
MKTRTLFIALAFLFIGSTTQAQFFKKLGKSAEKAAERAVTRKTEQKVSKETEKAMDTILGNGKKKKKTKKNKNQEVAKNEGPVNSPSETNTHEQPEITDAPEAKTWSKYNFVPGDKIIFDDDLGGEENGEFPSRWDLSQGNAENAKKGAENIIRMENKTIINPLMDKENYLPEVFTIEFDAYFNEGYASWQSYDIRFWQGNNYKSQGEDVFHPVKVYKDGATTHTRIANNPKKYDAHSETVGEKSGWKHIAISFNKRSLKVFVDDYRALNIPNYGYKPQLFSIGAAQHDPDGKTMAIKNIRVAEGGKKLYDRIMADGKFVTRGILFDVNKATLKPSSMGVINEVANMMQEHPDLKFRIEGHTDSDGEDTFNLQLSEQRAAAVKEALINSGIDTTKMTIKGMGESVPVSDNASPEGKANNRRVEFVKI